nr:zinc-binding dehydrogenase [Pseudomonas sp. K5002]
MGPWLDSITGWLTLNPQWLAVAVFIVACVECLAIAGLIVPGTVLLFAIAALAGSGALSLGETLLLGFLGGARAKDIDLLAILGKRAIVTGSLLRSRTREEKAAIAAQLREHVWPVLSAGRCLPMIDEVYAYTDAAKAHARMEGGDHIGKIVLRVD